MEKYGIIGAMESEVCKLCDDLVGKEIIEYAGLRFFTGILEGKDVVIVKSGIGKVNAALCAQALVLKFNVTKIINTGIAGAFAKGLGVFDFVVSTAAVYHDFDTTAFGYKAGQVPGMPETFVADKAMADTAVKAFNSSSLTGEHKITRGLIASGDQFISGGEKKSFIVSTFHPQCVEMEGCAIAHTCFANNVPFVIIRCMSDTADESVKTTYSEEIASNLSSTFLLEVIKEI